MITVRPILRSELDAFAALPGAPDPTLAARLAAFLAEGTTTLDRCLVAVDPATERPIGRAALVIDSPDPTLEAWLAAFWVAPDPDRDRGAVARALMDGLVAAAPDLAVPIDARINAEDHPDADDRRALLAAAGFGLFQEKVGLVWTDDGARIPEPRRVAFLPVTDVGHAALAGVMARCTAGTLDRNDAYFRDLVGPEAWGEVMQQYATPDDDPTWLLARFPDGRDAGYVLLSAFDEPATGTITHIGVVPEARGQGVVGELLLAVARGARSRGLTSVLSDVDVDNPPMLAAMERAGHRAGVRPWHIWHLRRAVSRGPSPR